MKTDAFIPRRLDDQWKLGLWDMDVASPVLAGFMMGYASGTKLGFVLCLSLGLASSRWMVRTKADKHPAFFLHLLYWHLPVNPLTQMLVTPPSATRRMIG